MLLLILKDSLSCRFLSGAIMNRRLVEISLFKPLGAIVTREIFDKVLWTGFQIKGKAFSF